MTNRKKRIKKMKRMKIYYLKCNKFRKLVNPKISHISIKALITARISLS